MLRRIVLSRLDAEEKKLGERVDYVRHIVRVSLSAFFRFLKGVSFGSYRKKLAADAWAVARIVAVRDEDCGPCLQTVVNLARQEGVPVEVLRAALDRQPGQLPADLADVYHFTEEVVQATYQEAELRERIRKRYGEEALVELALAIAGCRIYPVVKRVLGYAMSCQKVQAHA